MTLWQGILLGLVQGLTEFLPVSSSGHLALTRALTDMRISDETFVFVAVTLHVATLCSVLVVYGRRLWQIIVGTVRGNASDRRYALYLIVGTIPGALLGALFVRNHAPDDGEINQEEAQPEDPSAVDGNGHKGGGVHGQEFADNDRDAGAQGAHPRPLPGRRGAMSVGRAPR